MSDVEFLFAVEMSEIHSGPLPKADRTNADALHTHKEKTPSPSPSSSSS